MKEEIIIAGFGGQGVLSMGKILAYSALMEGREVTWMPAYGPEQRGGTANVTVIISDQSISSPILSTFDTAIILNQPSLDRFQDAIRPGGTLIYDSYGIMQPPTRRDLNIFVLRERLQVPSKEIAVRYNITVNNVDVIKHRIGNLLRKYGPDCYFRALRRAA